jgi:hypothetical protein
MYSLFQLVLVKKWDLEELKICGVSLAKYPLLRGRTTGIFKILTGYFIAFLLTSHMLLKWDKTNLGATLYFCFCFCIYSYVYTLFGPSLWSNICNVLKYVRYVSEEKDKSTYLFNEREKIHSFLV